MSIAIEKKQSACQKSTSQKRKKVAAVAKKCQRHIYSKLKIVAKTIKNMYKKRAPNNRAKKVAGKMQQIGAPARKFCQPGVGVLDAQKNIFGSLGLGFRVAGIEKRATPSALAGQCPGSRGTVPQTPCVE